MKKIQYNGSSKILNGIVTKVNLIIDKLVVDVKVNGTSVVVVNQEGEREADIDLSLADQNVKQSPTTDNKDYRVLLSKSDNDTEETDIARKNTDFKYNPSTGNLQATKLNGNTIPTDTDTLALNKDIPTQASDIGAIPATEKGANSGVATLDSSGKVPTTQLPSYVDDVVEGYYYNDNFYEDSAHTELITPETSKIYVDLSTDTCYRWGGSAYVEISGGAVQSDWNQNDSSQLDYIKNKPTIPTIPTVATGSVFGSLAFDNVNKFIDLKADSQSSGQDLNNYTTEGFYFFSSGNIPTNVPSGVNGFLLVIKSSYNVVKQFWIRQGSENTQSDTWVRLLTSSGWTTWRKYAMSTEITDAINALNVASTSLEQGETLATIAEADGKIAVTKQDIKIDLGQVDNGCRVGTSVAITSGVTWHKFASTTVSIGSAISIDAVFLVSNTAYDSFTGILVCYLRVLETGNIDAAELNFISSNGIDPSEFRLYYTIGAESITFELWTSIARRYKYRRFILLSQGERLDVYSKMWTLRNSTTASSAPTESATCIRVDCEDKSDTKVTQTAVSSSSNANYRLLLSKSASNTEETDGVYKDGGLYYNPYDEKLTAPNASFGTAFIPNLSVTSLVTAQYYFNHGSGSAVAMLEANSAATASSPIFNTLPASSGTLALQSEIPTIPTVATGSTFGSLSFDGTDVKIKLSADSQSSGQDLNNFKTAGIYNFTSANVPTNVPIGTNGILIVLTYGSVVKQIWMRQGTANSNDHQMYIRMYVSSWSRWHQYFMGEMIGGVENSTTASKAYAKNELMNFNGGIYRVTTAISSGGAITNNTNVVSTTLSAEIKAIRDALNI